jgi:hypothetical protein
MPVKSVETSRSTTTSLPRWPDSLRSNATASWEWRVPHCATVSPSCSLAEKLRKGVAVRSHGDSVKIDLYVVIEHGANLTQVSHNLADRVRYDLQTIAGVAVDDVDVHVQGVRVRK